MAVVAEQPTTFLAQFVCASMAAALSKLCISSTQMPLKKIFDTQPLTERTSLLKLSMEMPVGRLIPELNKLVEPLGATLKMLSDP